MKKPIIVLFFATVIFVTSCTTSRLVQKSTNSRNYQVNANETVLVLRPLMADISVDHNRKEVSYTSQNVFLLEDLKANAMQSFLKTHSCDYVIDPIFSFTKIKEKSKNIEATVLLSGLPAKYTKIYQVDSLPKSVLQIKDIEKTTKRLDYINTIEKSQSQARNSQMTLGLDFGLLNPKGVSNTQYGASIACKYSLDNFRLGINAGYYYNDTLSFSQVSFTIPIVASLEYSFVDGDISPYVGIDLGYYLIGYHNNRIGTEINGGFGFAPNFGLNYHLSDKIMINCNFKYNYLLSSVENLSMIGVNIGIGYKF